MEGVVIPAGRPDLAWYRGRRVLVTGHTGFKGSWLTLWLASLGAEVTGFALRPSVPSLFEDAAVGDACRSIFADVRDQAAVSDAVRGSRPEAVFHLAAQSLVGVGHIDPETTFATNVLGVVHLLEAIRTAGSAMAVVIVTSDKCYDLRMASSPRSETDPLGGADPYSASKAAAELVVAAYRSSFFGPERLAEHGIALATARAGNVIGGGDWAPDRIVPDAIRSLTAGRPVPVRHPSHIRPWQHVLEPLQGYLTLGARLCARDGAAYCEAWNFGPPAASSVTVRELVARVLQAWGGGEQVHAPSAPNGGPVESPALRLSIEKSVGRLGWRPRWDLDEACGRTVAWYRARASGAAPVRLRDLCQRQIEAYAATGNPVSR